MNQTEIGEVIKKAIIFLRLKNAIQWLSSLFDQELNEENNDIKLYVGMCGSKYECSYRGYERLQVKFRLYGDVYKNIEDIIFSPLIGSPLKIEYFILSRNKLGAIVFCVPISPYENISLCNGDNVAVRPGSLSFNRKFLN
ncbi:MAG: hypothetical protein HRU77_01720 [Gammaproteobacteria bacterium]|nr:MAG: hypothetical protein HRU77_01720 [Gammaproteobacteria bacterium]